jgi:hypothetical protein
MRKWRPPRGIAISMEMFCDKIGEGKFSILTSDPVLFLPDCIKFDINFMSTVKFYIQPGLLGITFLDSLSNRRLLYIFF